MFKRTQDALNFTMKKAIALFVLFSILIFSCKKNPIADNISYIELESQIQITSVDTVIQHPSGCGYIPSPSDSSTSIALDINNDGIDDYILTCKSWYQSVSASGPCANYNNSIIISGTSENNKISVLENYQLKSFNYNDDIDNSSLWNDNAALMYKSGQNSFGSYDFNGSVYIGLKVGNHFGWIYLDKSAYLITIMSYAVNQTVPNSIRAGQTE